MYECNGWVSLYQSEVYVNEPCADLTCGAHHRKTSSEDHDRNKSGDMRGRLVLFDITHNPQIYLLGGRATKKLQMF